MSNTKELSANMALRELKTLDSRIDDAIEDGVYVVQAKNSAKKISGKTREELSGVMKSNMQKVLDLMQYRDALKVALDKSNAVATIEINGKTITVAHALYMKSAISTQIKLLEKIKSSRATALREIGRANSDLESRFNSYLSGALGGKDNLTPQKLEEHRETFYNANEHSLIDPNKTDEFIQEWSETTSAFLDEIDGKLTDCNALTRFTVTW